MSSEVSEYSALSPCGKNRCAVGFAASISAKWPLMAVHRALLALLKISCRLLDVYDVESCFSAAVMADEAPAAAGWVRSHVGHHFSSIPRLNRLQALEAGRTCRRPTEKSRSPLSPRKLLFGDYTETTMAIEVCYGVGFSPPLRRLAEL